MNGSHSVPREANEKKKAVRHDALCRGEGGRYERIRPEPASEETATAQTTSAIWRKERGKLLKGLVRIQQP